MVFLGLIALCSLGLGGALAFVGKSVPDFIVATGSGSLSALGTLLARTGSEGVRIENDSQDPVPTVEV